MKTARKYIVFSSGFIAVVVLLILYSRWKHQIVQFAVGQYDKIRYLDTYIETAEGAIQYTVYNPKQSGSGRKYQSINNRSKTFDTVNDTIKRDSRISSEQTRTDRVFRLLAWNNVSNNNPFWRPHHREDSVNCGTPIPCTFTNDISLFATSDVVIFNTRTIYIDHKMPGFHPPHQHWITFLHEAPTRDRMFVHSPYNSWFNWTYTYSLIGDSVNPYGICLPNREKIAKDPGSITDAIRQIYGKSVDSTPWLNSRHREHTSNVTNYASGKTGLVLWAVGHCKTESKREKYVAELKRYIKIDIFGSCVKNKTLNLRDHFLTHKFYLAFENSICTDYITEKTWGPLSSGSIVPIVLGGADYKTYLPPHSYIDIKNFSSPKALATYLKKVHKNDTLYNEYFAWKTNYTCYKSVPGKGRVCDICKFINENINKTSIIADINKMWSPDLCIPATRYFSNVATLPYNDAFKSTAKEIGRDQQPDK